MCHSSNLFNSRKSYKTKQISMKGKKKWKSITMTFTCSFHGVKIHSKNNLDTWTLLLLLYLYSNWNVYFKNCLFVCTVLQSKCDYLVSNIERWRFFWRCFFMFNLRLYNPLINNVTCYIFFSSCYNILVPLTRSVFFFDLLKTFFFYNIIISILFEMICHLWLFACVNYFVYITINTLFFFHEFRITALLGFH